MATLGIYGDSFADDRHAWTERAVLTESAWSYMLGNDFDKHKNYAQCASSLYYSYSKFLSTHELYDRIVFIVTSRGRWPGSIKVPGYFKSDMFLGNYDTCVEFLTSDYLRPLLTNEHKQVIQSVRDWFLYSQVDQYEVHMERLMLADIQQIRPDAIVVRQNNPNYKTPGIAPGIFHYLVLGYEMLKPELLTVGCDYSVVWQRVNQSWQESLNSIICHMTPEINLVCYEHMKQALRDGIWNPTLPTHVPHAHTWDHHYMRRNLN